MTGSRRIIVGLDPGTTIGYAVLSLHGRTLAVRSSKQLNLNKVIHEVYGKGIPIIVGTDKAKCPDMVRKFAARTGAIKVMPDYDVSEREKNLMVKDMNISNNHQKDALAAALLAYKHYEPLLKRMEKFLAQERQLAIAEEVAHIVVRKKISIKKALKLVEKDLPLVSSY